MGYMVVHGQTIIQVAVIQLLVHLYEAGKAGIRIPIYHSHFLKKRKLKFREIRELV